MARAERKFTLTKADTHFGSYCTYISSSDALMYAAFKVGLPAGGFLSQRSELPDRGINKTTERAFNNTQLSLRKQSTGHQWADKSLC
ncbi:hypothetical protein TRIATDRAFT_159732 [Trichoderma atroviride IMI 206040]|uniref:Uncharacterized protein n=1 Tax=Hypocrea atroviridis (strain ATCC 20476 / IMI 206040) TaxID=452589 RepID=G9NGS6_HYPAI|nr:uncharacterized protein TRIATDRAFT_159732 [Trichoderma atroviride IMI 206040]EHK50486.1 hypothetical protein TRIATDRAFT_159732 [Trichoderma atroviride IMI 206040]